MNAFNRFLTTLTLTLSFVLLGCRAVVENAPRPLELNLGVEPSTLDPALATAPGSQQIIRMIFLSLVDIDAPTGAPQQSLASSWAVSADGLIWEFRIRDDATWVRYIPSLEKFEVKRQVTTQDIVYSVRRIFDPRVGSGFASVFATMIRGAQELRSADVKKTSEADWQRLFDGLGVESINDTTVRFTLTRPAGYFPSIVSTWLVRTQPRESVEAGGSVWTEPGTVWTNGPYAMEQWSHGREIILRKNPYYFNADGVQIDRISLTMIADTATALDEYNEGRLDSLDPYGNITPTDYDKLRDDPLVNKQLQIVPTLCTHYYGFNTTKAPFNELNVRKAFIASIDRETLATSVVKLGDPARWFTRPGIMASFNISDTMGIPFNVNQAREYLKNSNFDRRKPITLGVNSNETHERIAETIVQMWKNNLSVEVAVKALDWKNYTQQLRDDPPQVYRLGYCAYYPDASNFGGVFQSKSADNNTRWGLPQFDQTIDVAARELDLSKRIGLYRTAEKILVEDNAVIVPLWWSNRATLTKPNVQRSYAITDGYERFDTWSFK